MFRENFIYLFIDKFAENHLHQNNITKLITIKHINQDDYNVLHDSSAISIFNLKFSNFFTLPTNIDFNFYHVLFLTNSISQVSLTLFGINFIELQKYITSYCNLPNHDLFEYVVYQHLQYELASCKLTDSQEKINNNIINKIYNENHDVSIRKFKRLKNIKIKLFNYQKKTINWMYQRETNSNDIHIYYENILPIKQFVVNLDKNEINEINEINKQNINLQIKGGGLIDEMGLGKTIQIIALSYINKTKNRGLDLINKIIKSRATLIICPNTLCGQWKREIEKVLNTETIKVLSLLTKTHYDKYTYQDYIDANFIIISFNFLLNDTFLEEITENEFYFNIRKKLSNAGIHDKQIFYDKINQVIQNEKNKLTEDFLMKKRANLFLINWHRIIIDEFHEINTPNKTNYLNEMHLIKNFTTTYRWCVSGTPFNNKTCSILEIFNFLTAFQFEQINLLNQHNIVEYLSTKCFKRNTKELIKDEYQMKKIHENIVWLNFTETEQQIYNAYVADKNMSSDDLFLRQLCCYFKLANETKDILLNCKTLKELEVHMLKHFENEVNTLAKKINCLKKTIFTITRQIKKYKLINNEINNNNNNDNNLDQDNLVQDNLDQDNLDQDNLDQDNLDQDNISDSENDYSNTMLSDLELKLQIKTDKLVENEKKYQGKNTTYQYYKNVIELIKKKSDLNQETNENTDENDYCGICLGDFEPNNICVTKCGHVFCYTCLISIFNTTSQICPYCRIKLDKNDITRVKNDISELNPQKNNLIDNVGTKLAAIIKYLKRSKRNIVIFSQWAELLKKIGDILTSYNIKNIFCQGNVYQKDKIIRQFDTSDIRIIMLSSENSASGTNLTKASEVIFIDPINGDKQHRINIENQAIARIHRIGQKHNIRVTKFLIKNTIEQQIYESNKE